MRDEAVGSVFVPDYCAAPIEVWDGTSLQVAWYLFEGMMDRIAAREGKVPNLIRVDGWPVNPDNRITVDTDDLIEALAALEHDQWIYWTQNLADTGAVASDCVDRWRAQWIPYADLTEENKEHDRVWARTAIAICRRVLGVES